MKCMYLVIIAALGVPHVLADEGIKVTSAIDAEVGERLADHSTVWKIETQPVIGEAGQCWKVLSTMNTFRQIRNVNDRRIRVQCENQLNQQK